jgi:hypothetical protein
MKRLHFSTAGWRFPQRWGESKGILRPRRLADSRQIDIFRTDFIKPSALVRTTATDQPREARYDFFLGRLPAAGL